MKGIRRVKVVGRGRKYRNRKGGLRAEGWEELVGGKKEERKGK